MPYVVPSNREQSEFKGGISILAGPHFQYTAEGGTLDATVIGAGYVPCGTAFVQNITTGRYEPWDDVDTAGDNYRDPVICDVDFDCDGVNHVVVGQLLFEGEVYDAKLPDNVTDAFKALTPRIRYNTRGY